MHRAQLSPPRHSRSRRALISYCTIESQRRYSRESSGRLENDAGGGRSSENESPRSECEIPHRTSPSAGARPKSRLTSGLVRADSRSETVILPEAIPENEDATLLTWFQMKDLALMENPTSLPLSDSHGTHSSTVRTGSVPSSNLQRLEKSFLPSTMEQASERTSGSFSNGHSSMTSRLYRYLRDWTYLTFESAGALLADIAIAPRGRLSFSARMMEASLAFSETDVGRSILARFILTLTPASVLLDISRHPSDHQVSLLRA